MTLALGTSLGPYVILERLGSGGMGEVYRARDPRLGRDVAVKILPARLAESAEAHSRLEHESQVLASLSHPNILEVFDVGLDRGIAFAVTELLEGQTLARRLRKGPLNWRDAAEIAGSVADGLAAAHARGIIHRDLKPDNVFLTRDGRVKILDFGLAERRRRGVQLSEPGSGTRESPDAVAGTLVYMSPEQVRGDVLDTRSDLFAFGAVLYEMLSGRRAFSGTDGSEIVQAILQREPDFSLLAGDVPVDLTRLIGQCLSKSPSDRVRSAESAAVVLRSLETSSRLNPVGRIYGRDLPRGTVVMASALVVVLAVTAALFLFDSPRIRSLAVAPVVNDTGDPGLDYVADRLTEALVERLSDMGSVRVASRLATRAAWRTSPDPRELGRALDVEGMVLSSLHQARDRVIVSLEIVEVRDGSRIAGKRILDDLGDLFELENRLAELVAENLRAPRRVFRPPAPPVRHTNIPAAYQAYVKGRFHWHRRSKEDLRQALALFEDAIRLDPNFSPAHAGVAQANGVLVKYGFVPPREGWPLALAAAARALELDPDLSDAHAIVGSAACTFLWDWAACERSLKRALDLNPENVTARQWMVQLLVGTGRPAEALEELVAARELEPVAPILLAAECALHTYSGDPVRGEPACRDALELQPGFPPALLFLSLSLREQGLLAEAAEVLLGAGAPTAGGDWAAAEYGFILARSGNVAGARQVLSDLRANSDRRYVSPYFEAIVLAGLEDRGQAFDALDRAMADRSTHLATIQVDPAMNSLRDDPRFTLLLRRMNLTRVAGASR